MVFRVYTFKDDDGVWHLKKESDDDGDDTDYVGVHDRIAALIDTGEF